MQAGQDDPMNQSPDAPALDAERRTVLRARGLTKIYGAGEAEVQALRGVDLELYESELIVLLGPSGSGKSTLLNILGGLDRPTAGEVEFQGRALGDLDDCRLLASRRAKALSPDRPVVPHDLLETHVPVAAA